MDNKTYHVDFKTKQLIKVEKFGDGLLIDATYPRLSIDPEYPAYTAAEVRVLKGEE